MKTKTQNNDLGGRPPLIVGEKYGSSDFFMVRGSWRPNIYLTFGIFTITKHLFSKITKERYEH